MGTPQPQSRPASPHTEAEARKSTAPPPGAVALQVGACRVDLKSREVHRAGDASVHRLSSKALHVLLELAATPGEVVTRAELFERVWAGTFPTDDVLTQAIVALRRALQQSPDVAPYIETIAKSGYRLMAPVAWVNASAPRKPRRWPLWVVAAAVLVAAVLYGAQKLRTPMPSTGDAWVDSAPTIIAASPQHEHTPRLAPDGSRVAFSLTSAPGERSRLMVQTTAMSTPQAVTRDNVQADESAATWSPDGRWLIFERRYDDGRCELMRVESTGGTPATVSRCLDALSPDYEWDVARDRLLGGGEVLNTHNGAPIQALDLHSGEWRPLEYALPTGAMDNEPRISPDGRWLAFRRGNPLSADIWVMPVEGGTPRRLSSLSSSLRGHDWNADSASLTLVHGGVWPAELIRVPLEGNIERLRAGVGITGFDSAAHASQAVVEVPRSRRQLFAVSLVEDQPDMPLFASSGNELVASVSPDGANVALYSDRSGRLGLWLAALRPTPGTPRLVEGVEPMLRFAPNWSADGMRLAIVVERQGQARLLEVARDTLHVRTLVLEGVEPRYAQYLGADRLLIGLADQSLALAMRTGDRLAVAQRMAGVVFARVHHRTGQILAIRPGDRRVHRLRPDLTGAEVVLADQTTSPAWAIAGDNLVMFLNDGEQAFVLTWPMDTLSGPPRTRQRFRGEPVISFNGLDNDHLVVARLLGQGSDIGLLALHTLAQNRN